MIGALERWIPKDDKNHEWPQILVILVACLSSFTIGLHFAWPAPSVPFLTSNSSHLQPFTLEEASYFTVIPPIAAIISAPILAILVDSIGRKKTVMFIAVPYIASFVAIIFAENITMFYVSRFFTGIGDAALFNSLPMYVGEIAVPSVRGSWGNTMALAIYLGQLVINIIGAYLNVRTTACICIVFPIIELILTMFIPESPYYLLMKNREAEARESLRILRWKNNVDDEMVSLTKDVQRQISESGTWKDLVSIPTNRRALVVAIGIRGAQQLSGLGSFSLYTQFLFNQAGGNLTPQISAIIFCATLVITNTSFSFVVNKFGRRPMMIYSSLGCGITVALLATYFYIYEKTNLDVSHLSWVPLVMLMVYILVCSSGLGILPTLMLGELFSASIKGKALCVANIGFSLYLLTVPKIFQILWTNFYMFVPLYLFSVCCFLSVIFSYYIVPETKGKTLEEIQQSLRKDKCYSNKEQLK